MQKLLLLQGGGPTTVFNATLAGVLRECRDQPLAPGVYGARSGLPGLISGELLRLDELSPDRVSQVGQSPGAALRSSRLRLTEQELLQACEVLRRLEIDSILFMGGNGTMRSAESFSTFCRDHDLTVQVIGVPKTIDNDIVGTDRCPGFGGAARFVAQSIIDLAMDLRSLPQPVTIFETLGRDVGWIAGASTLAKREQDDAPHVVCVPEISFDLDSFLSRIDDAVRRVGWAVGVVSEGTRHPDGRPVFEQEMPTMEGSANRPLIGGVAQHLSGLVTRHTGLRCRSEKPGLLGRCSMAYVSRQDAVDAELAGREGVRALRRGETGVMVSLLPLAGGVASGYRTVPFSEVTVGSRALPAEWMSEGGLAVNDECRSYMQAIVGDLQFYPVL